MDARPRFISFSLFALAQQHLRALNFALSAKKAIGRDAQRLNRPSAH
jgi:hypothetical protein